MIKPDVLFHEIRAIASSILSLTRTMRDLGYTEIEVEHLIDAAHFASKAIIDVNTYYTKRAINKNPEKPILSETNIRFLVNHVITIVRGSDYIGNIKLICDIEENVSTTIKTDKILLTGILQNLVINAVKFSNEEGKVMIHMRAKDQRLLISVEDHGIGISEANLEVIFQPYVFLSNPRFQGMGIGLHKAKTDAISLGGDIEVTSKIAEGSTFTINLPLL